MNLSFKEKVLAIVRAIPAGKTLTYKQVATVAGKPQASRAVGNIMSKNYDPSVPCHRVIRSDGKLGDYNRGGNAVKRALLRSEEKHEKNSTSS